MKGQGKGLVHDIFRHFEKEERFTLKDAYRTVPDKPKETVRARIGGGGHTGSVCREWQHRGDSHPSEEELHPD